MMLRPSQTLSVCYVLAWIMGLTGAVKCLQAQAPERPLVTPTEVPPSGRRDASALVPGQLGVVVLTDGKVLTGQITETGGGYRIDNNGTFSTVPYGNVKVTALTIADAYQRIHETMNSPLAGDHLILCEWCIEHDLWNEAQLEVALALRLEPLRTDAQALLWKIEQHFSGTNPRQGMLRVLPMRKDPVREQAAAGFSKELQQQFIRQIQPLVMNKCGSAGCHGGENERLFRVSGTRSSNLNYRLNSDGNLSAILQQINVAEPQLSPFLTKPAELTASHRKLFQGPSGGAQRQSLVDWVSRVAAEQRSLQSPAQASVAMLQVLPATSPQPVAVAPTVSSPTQVTTAEGIVIEDDATASQPLDKAALQAILRQQAPDLFDPEIYNELVHGRRSNP